jgi:hypothetical protein
MKKRIEKYIPHALKAVRAELLKNPANKTDVYEEYDGYAASLGASIITSSLLPALSFYTDIHRSGEKEKPRRYKILKAIAQIVNTDGMAVPVADNGLLEFMILAANNTAENKAKIIDASIALKLALRNFNHVKSL